MGEDDTDDLDTSMMRAVEIEPGVSAEEKQQITEVIQGKDKISLPQGVLREPAPVDPMKEVAPGSAAAASEKTVSDLRAQLAEMKLPQKIKVAMFGNSICRGLLIRDSNKIIQLCVLKNPKLMLVEVVDFSKNPHLSDLVLRTIARNKEWTRDYAVKVNIVSNPKTPADISLKWLRFLTEGDMKKLSRSKNIPQLIATTARKILQAKGGK